MEAEPSPSRDGAQPTSWRNAAATSSRHPQPAGPRPRGAPCQQLPGHAAIGRPTVPSAVLPTPSPWLQRRGATILCVLDHAQAVLSSGWMLLVRSFLYHFKAGLRAAACSGRSRPSDMAAEGVPWIRWDRIRNLGGCGATHYVSCVVLNAGYSCHIYCQDLSNSIFLRRHSLMIPTMQSVVTEVRSILGPSLTTALALGLSYIITAAQRLTTQAEGHPREELAELSKGPNRSNTAGFVST
jgi:hypothetical protein